MLKLSQNGNEMKDQFRERTSYDVYDITCDHAPSPLYIYIKKTLDGRLATIDTLVLIPLKSSDYGPLTTSCYLPQKTVTNIQNSKVFFVSPYRGTIKGNRGYYMTVRGYAFYLRVLLVSLTSEHSERVRDSNSTRR